MRSEVRTLFPCGLGALLALSILAATAGLLACASPAPDTPGQAEQAIDQSAPAIDQAALSAVPVIALPSVVEQGRVNTDAVQRQAPAQEVVSVVDDQPAMQAAQPQPRPQPDDGSMSRDLDPSAKISAPEANLRKIESRGLLALTTMSRSDPQVARWKLLLDRRRARSGTEPHSI